MKPALTMLETGGTRGLAEEHSRLLKGSSWKRNRIVVVVPAGDSIPAKVALSHWALSFPPNNGVCRILAQGLEVGEAYSSAIESVLAHPDLGTWEFILTVEHDNLPPPDGVLRLVEQMQAHPEFAAIGGLYFTKGPGGVAQVWGDPKDPTLNFRPLPPDPNGGLVECCGTGMGFTLFRLKMFHDKKLRRPWFETKAGHSQDLYAWTDFRKNGYRCAIDCSIRVGHYDLKGEFGIEDFVW
jgi:hypothetical protein